MPDVIINMDDMAAIFAVTDVMGIHRESVSVDLTREDPGSINRTGAGVIELTVPETRSAQDFATELQTALEAMGYVAAPPEEDDEEGAEQDENDDAEQDEEDTEETGDAYSSEGSGRRRRRKKPEDDPEEKALGIGQVIKLRFFYSRIPYEIDCEIVDRFNPNRYKNVDLTPRWGVGFRVRPLTDMRKRDQRRYVRYTHRLGFGHLRLRNEITFNAFVVKTNLEYPEKGALKQTITNDDYEVFPYGSRDVEEVRDAERIEDIVEFFMGCMVSNAAERRHAYSSKPYLDRLNRSSLEGLGYFNVVGAQQTTVLPKIFVKRQMKGASVLEKQVASKSHGKRDARRMRTLEEAFRHRVIDVDRRK